MASTKTETVSNPPQKYGEIVLTLENVLLPPEKLDPSPSFSDGLDADTEFDLRVMGCEMIQTSGILLRLPQVAMACGQVLFQRLYYAKSLVRYPMEATAMACIALASKIEEAPRKIRDVINVFKHIRQVKNGRTMSPVVLDANYITLKNQVIKAERRLLKELGFCCHVKHPHKMIIVYLRLVDAHDNRNLAKTSWNYMNDALRTDVSMRYNPESIACACIWLAARQVRVPLPENPPWYNVVKVNIDDIQQIAASILKLYTRPKVKLEVLEAKVEEIRRQQQEARLRNKLLPPTQQTPVQPVTSTFSPGSRNESPRHAKGHHANKRKDNTSDTSHSSGSRRSRSNASPSRKKRRSDSRDPSRSRSRSRGRSRDRSRDRHHHSRKTLSRSVSPDVTPPPRFTKNKEKGPIVRSLSRSRSRSPRSPLRTYDKYERQDKYDRQDKYGNKYERKDRHSDKHPGKNDRYVSDQKYEVYDNKNEKYSDNKNSKYDRNDRYVEKSDRYKHDKNVKYSEKSDRIENNYKDEKHNKDDKLNYSSKYDIENKDKLVKYDKVDKYSKYDKKKSTESKKSVDNGYDKIHKNKKSSRHRSRSRDHRR